MYKATDFRSTPDERAAEAIDFLKAEAPEANVSKDSWPAVTDTPHCLLVLENCPRPKEALEGFARGVSEIVREHPRTDFHEDGATFYVLP